MAGGIFGSGSNRSKGSFLVGGAHVLLGQGLRFLIQIVSLVVLSRLLPPADFGVMALLLATVSLGVLLGDMGLSVASLREVNISQSVKSNIFWLNLAMGVVLWIAISLAAPWVAKYFDVAPLAWVLPIAGSFVFLPLLSSQSKTELLRQRRFAFVAAAETISAFLGLAVAILVALTGAGIWALLTQQIVVLGSAGLAFLLCARWRPSLPDRAAGMSAILSFGWFTFLAQVVTFVSNSADTFVLGKVWGSGELGVYNRGAQIARLPILQLAPPLTKVAIPYLADTSSDPDELRARLAALQRSATYFFLLFLSFVCLFAEEIVLLVLGQAWLGAVPIIRVLTIAAALQAMGNPFYWALVSAGRAKIILISEIVGRGLSVVLMIAWVSNGVVFVAWATVAGAFILFLGQLLFVSIFTPARFWDCLLGALTPLVISSLATAAALWLSASDWVAGLELWSRTLVLGGTWAGLLLFSAMVIPRAKQDASFILGTVRRLF